MDSALVERLEAEMAYEAARTAPPPDFPALADLPLNRYTDDRFYELERDHLWSRAWLFAVHGSELPEPGDYRLIDIAGAPLLVVRGEDAEIRAFFNSCRHRGAPVVRDDAGNARLLTCQYHSWTYDLAGNLVQVPDERDFVGLCREDRGLMPVRCEAWGDFVFVNRDADALPLLEWLAPIPEQLPELVRQPWRCIGRTESIVACNWKVTAEAFLEVYHLRTIHPKTVNRLLDHKASTMGLLANGHTRMVTKLRDAVIDQGGISLGLPTSPEMGEIFRTTNTAYGMFPNLIAPIDVVGFPLLVFWPIDIRTTRIELVWIACDWGDGERPAAWDTVLAGFTAVMEEDERNMAPIQRSIEAAAHGGVPLNYQERRIQHFHAWVDHHIGVERIPEELRVPDTLAHLVER